MKPLARWTIGYTESIGKDMLRESLVRFKKLYPEFDRVVCYNHIDAGELGFVKGLADLYEQYESEAPCPLSKPFKDYEESVGCGWKLCPSRLRLAAHELWIDNDIIIFQRLPEIDRWLASATAGLICEGMHRRRMFGAFDHLIPPEIRACAGMFGLPPHFDFSAIALRYCRFLGIHLGGYNEQGFTVAMVVNLNDYVFVPLTTMFIMEDQAAFPKQLPPALHFVGANRKNWHSGWKQYCSIKDLGVLL